MNRSYTQLTEIERYQNWIGLSLGNTQSKIAECLEVHKSMISREIKRNSRKRGCRPKQAHLLFLARQQTNNAAKLDYDLWKAVESLIRMDWSPQQASEWLKRNTPIRSVTKLFTCMCIKISAREETSSNTCDVRSSGRSDMARLIVGAS